MESSIFTFCIDFRVVACVFFLVKKKKEMRSVAVALSGLAVFAVLAVILSVTDDVSSVELVAAGPGLHKLDAMFDAEQAQRDSDMEKSLQSSIAADQRRLGQLATKDGLTPRESRIRDKLHKSMTESANFVGRIARDEADKQTGETGREEARLRALNKAAADGLARVNMLEKKENEEEYRRNVLNIQDHIKRNKNYVQQAGLESNRDDTNYIAGLKSTIDRHGSFIRQIEKDEYERKHVAMRARLDSGRKRQSQLEDAVRQTDGPAGYSPRQSNFVKNMKNQLEADAKAVAAARSVTKSKDQQIEEALMKRNRNAINCLSSKAYLRGGC